MSTLEFLQDTGPEPPLKPAGVTKRQREVLHALTGVRRVEELAAELGGHPNSTRAQLRTLEAKGLVARQMGTPQGRGRPAARYRRTESGDMTVDGTVPVTDAMTKLAEVLTEDFATRPHAAARAQELGRQWGRTETHGSDTADDPKQRLFRLATRLGFTPLEVPDGLHLRRCPLLELARRHPQMVCSLHLGVLEGGLRDQDALDVRLEAFAPHGCRAVLSPHKSKAKCSGLD